MTDEPTPMVVGRVDEHVKTYSQFGEYIGLDAIGHMRAMVVEDGAMCAETARHRRGTTARAKTKMAAKQMLKVA